MLFISLLGSSLTCCVFGSATTLKQAIAIRLMQGIFAGAIGVARGCVTVVTDPSNEGRAYAILGFCWGFGGVAGAIVGGTCEFALSRLSCAPPRAISFSVRSICAQHEDRCRAPISIEGNGLSLDANANSVW